MSMALCARGSHAVGSPTAAPTDFAGSVQTLAGSTDSLNSLRAEWNNLLENSGANSIFLTWDWMHAWLASVCPQARFALVAVRSADGKLVGVTPVYRTGFRLLRVLPYRGLRILGDACAAAEYPDLIIRHGYEQAVAPLLMNGIMRSAPGGCLWMRRVSGWSGARDRVNLAAQNLGLEVLGRHNDFGALDLPDSVDDYLAKLSGNQRSMLRRRTKQLQKSAKVEFELCVSTSQLASLLDDLYRLHQSRWSEQSRAGADVRRRRLADFNRQFAPVALEKGWLRLAALRVDGVVQAIQYGYLYDGVYMQVQEGFDPNGPEGAGNVLRLMAIESLIQEGVRKYDFLGHYSEHKRRWGAERRLGWDFLIGPRTLKNRIVFGKRVWPTGRFLREHHPVGIT